MNVYLVDSLSSCEEAVEVEDVWTVRNLKQKAASLFGYAISEFTLSSGGVDLDDDADLSAVLQDDDSVVVSVSPEACFSRRLQGGERINTLPEWVHGSEQCVRAALQHACDAAPAAPTTATAPTPFAFGKGMPPLGPSGAAAGPSTAASSSPPAAQAAPASSIVVSAVAKYGLLRPGQQRGFPSPREE